MILASGAAWLGLGSAYSAETRLGVVGGIVSCGVVYGLARVRRGDLSPAPPTTLSRPTPAPLPVVYSPLAPDDLDANARDAELRDLEETLLRLCRGDPAVFDRLLEYERRREPFLGRREHLRMAIDHYRRDHA